MYTFCQSIRYISCISMQKNFCAVNIACLLAIQKKIGLVESGFWVAVNRSALSPDHFTAASFIGGKIHDWGFPRRVSGGLCPNSHAPPLPNGMIALRRKPCASGHSCSNHYPWRWQSISFCIFLYAFWTSPTSRAKNSHYLCIYLFMPVPLHNMAKLNSAWHATPNVSICYS